MDIQKLRQEIEADEGNVHEIYLDHLNLPTFGIGHLVRDTDPEHGQPVGTPVSEERVNSCFDNVIPFTFDPIFFSTYLINPPQPQPISRMLCFLFILPISIID